MKRITFIISLILAALSIGSCININDLRPNDPFDDFKDQNIPQNLCGTYYQVDYDDYYYQYLTINPDGTIEGVYVSDGESLEVYGACYYGEGKISLCYKLGNRWGADSDEETVVEWTSEYLVLGNWYASFLTKSKQIPKFVGLDHDVNLIGEWIYNRAENVTSTLILKENGLGSKELSSNFMLYDNDEIVNWFTFNEWLYIKYDGNIDYEIWRYNLLGEELYLYHCDVLEYDPYKYQYNTSIIEPGSDNDKPSSLKKVSVAEFIDAPESSDVWYELTGEIIGIASDVYGNLDISDGTGEVYIYGLTNGWVGKNDKSFASIGLKVGDIVTIGALRSSYKDVPQGGGPAYYISHISGDDSGENEDESSATDLTYYGQTANCYVVSSAGTYKFKTVMGNSSESVGTVSSVEVLWESFGTSETPSVGDLVKNVSYSDGYIQFSTPSTFREGNAVIAAKNSSGTILWSWHIWLTDYPAEHVYANNAGIMMDRNLGATSATPGDVGALGLLYQWGRKDPFLGSSSISSSIEAKSTGSWPSTVSSSSSTGTIVYATKNPMTFITYNESNYDWYYTGDDSTYNARWKSSKTIYDPCPPGWRVPDGGSNGVWAKAGFNNHSYDDANEGMLFGSGYSSPSAWYPASGFRNIRSGSLSSVGSSGRYWSVSPNVMYAHYLTFDTNGFVSPSNSYYRALGQLVRCLQE